MSADNILLILKDGDKISVYDVNFSDVSSRDDWQGSMTAENAASLLAYCKSGRGPFHVWTGKSIKAAENECRRIARQEVVEYGHVICIPADGRNE